VSEDLRCRVRQHICCSKDQYGQIKVKIQCVRGKVNRGQLLILDRNVKFQLILTKLRALTSEYISERTPVFIDSGSSNVDDKISQFLLRFY